MAKPIIVPGGAVLARFFFPMGLGFALSLRPGVGNSPFQESPGGLPWGWSGLELIDTLIIYRVFQTKVLASNQQ